MCYVLGILNKYNLLTHVFLTELDDYVVFATLVWRSDEQVCRWTSDQYAAIMYVSPPTGHQSSCLVETDFNYLTEVSQQDIRYQLPNVLYHVQQSYNSPTHTEPTSETMSGEGIQQPFFPEGGGRIVYRLYAPWRYSKEKNSTTQQHVNKRHRSEK